jgi:sn-glycerol 3-phosphate transport system substrate-binding protein
VRKSLRSGIGALAVSLTLVTAAGCSSAGSAGPAAVTAAPGESALNGKGEVQITFWHEMGGTNGQELTKLINEFNAQHRGKIKVKLSFKTDYDTALAAYKTASPQQRPDVLQMYDIGTRYMIDSKTAIPAQEFIDADHYNVSDLQPNISGYYTVDNKLYSMPFNTSMPLLYINQQAFKKAGLDPNKPPTTLAEIMADAKKIKAASGETVKYPFGASIYGWFFEQWDAVANQDLCDADNGRTGRADKVNLATDTNVTLLKWWQEMTQQGLAEKLDSDTTTGDNAFTSGTVAMLPESTGSLGGFTQASAIAHHPFTVGTGYFPKIAAGDSGGPIIGGASLWVINSGNAARERASWDLEKFLDSTQSQVAWHTTTGYFPVTKAALDDPADKKWVAKNPQFGTAVQQLQHTPLNHATQGCSVGEMPQVRQDVQNAIQAVVLQNQDPRTALTNEQKIIDGVISSYNAKLK